MAATAAFLFAGAVCPPAKASVADVSAADVACADVADFTAPGTGTAGRYLPTSVRTCIERLDVRITVA